MQPVLDPCCGGRSFWFDKNCPVAIFGDVRAGSWELCDGRTFSVLPDEITDFTNLHFDQETFNLVVFDPPHFRNVGEDAYMHIKYGRLGDQWEESIKKGFSECFRVLKDGGVLVFKWCEYQVKLTQLLKLAEYRPLFGNRKPGNDKTHWVVFIKNDAMKKGN